MKPFLFSILLALGFQGHSNAQSGSTCRLPEVRGLAVGMTVEQIKQRFKSFRTPEADSYGYAEFNDDFILEKGRYESDSGDSRVANPLEGLDTTGLARVDMAFLDGRIVTLVVSYKDSVEWRDIEEFVEALSPVLKLPGPKEWTKVDTVTLRLTCSKGAIKATLDRQRGGVGSSITMGEMGITAELVKRRQDEKERARKTFKP